MRTQVSWLSIQTPFQYHFSDSSIGSLIKLCASHCLWFETRASRSPSLSGVKVACWLAPMEGRGLARWGLGILIVERDSKLKLKKQGRSGLLGKSFEWWWKGAGNGSQPGVGPWWGDLMCLCVPFRWPWPCLPGLSIHTWVRAIQMTQFLEGIISTKRTKKVFKIKKYLFEICPSKLDTEIVNFTLHSLVLGRGRELHVFNSFH